MSGEEEVWRTLQLDEDSGDVDPWRGIFFPANKEMMYEDHDRGNGDDVITLYIAVTRVSSARDGNAKCQPTG